MYVLLSILTNISEYKSYIKSDINTKKDRCEVVHHFINKFRDLKIQPIEQVSSAKEEASSLTAFGTKKNIGKSYCLPSLMG